MSQSRRQFLRAGAVGTLALAGCGDTAPLGGQTRKLARSAVAIDYDSYYAPYPDVRRLALARAGAVGAQVTFSDDAAGSDAQVANLERWSSKRGAFRAIAVAPFDPGAVAAVARRAAERDVFIVAYVTPIDGQAAAITVPWAKAGTLLAQDARRRQGGDGVVLVGPPAGALFGDGFAAATAAIGAVLPVTRTVTALGSADAEQAIRQLRRQGDVPTVLTWNDTTALGAAAALPRQAYVGGLGAPSLSGRAALAALDDDGPLRCLVAPRLSDLAAALVDVPFAFARTGTGKGREVPVEVLRRGSARLRAFEADFSA